ncbi:MAG: helix-turn-helix transcriptional regulator, partial [Lacticaseibacillus paracasei]|nr:helix-turn-helix transcriptional regulator [Lacticaseibacillus paracasei]
MHIDQVIRERRLALGLTQEELANKIGVSAPAVSKWEKGVSYPDITLLPALARILGTDVNT